MNTSVQSLSFNSVTLIPVSHNGKLWLTSSDIAKALGYSREDSVNKIHERNKDEFSDSMTTVLSLRQNDVLGENQGLQRERRVFSLRGCHLIAMFSKTAIAKEFRKWVLDILDKQAIQYGLKSLSASPYVTAKEKLQLRLAIESHCAKTGDSHRAVWLKLNKAYQVNTLELLPTGKVPEMLAYLGLRVPEIDEMVLVPQRKLLALENKTKALPNQVVMTQAELQAHDEQVASEAVKRVQGELVNEPKPNSITLHLPPLPNGENVKRFFVTQYTDEVRWGVIKEGYYFDKAELQKMTIKQLSHLVA